jgi:hypothetical protein
MTRMEKPLIIVLTPTERKRLRPVLEGEGIDTRSPTAIKNWLLDQAGIEPEEEARGLQDCRYRNLAEDLCGGERP